MMLSVRAPFLHRYPQLQIKQIRFASSEIKSIPDTYTHYQVLNISEDADPATIKKSFRKLSKRYHPDVNQRIPTLMKPIVKSNYLRIMNAYEILKDSSKRSEYDSSISAKQNRTINENEFYASRKQYSSGGINQTRNRVWYGPGHQSSPNRSFDPLHGPSGNNHDVPHFDYDTHLRGNLWFERRMINKRISKLHHFDESHQHQHQRQQNRRYDFHDKQRDLQEEIQDTLNYHRFGGHQYVKHNSYTVANNSATTTLFLIGLGTVLTMVGFWSIH